MKRPLAILLSIVACGSLAWVAIPVVLIRPFVAQTAGGLSLAYALRAARPQRPTGGPTWTRGARSPTRWAARPS